LPSAVHRIGPHAQSVIYLFKLICPSNVPVPVAVPVAKSIVWKLIIVNVPVALANWPVPFSIVATSVILAVFGGMKRPSIPTNVPDSWSPFAAVKVKVPVDVFSGVTSAASVAVNLPRWVAVPSAVPRAEGGGTLIKRVYEPRNGSSVPPRAAVRAGPKLACVGDVGEFRAWPLVGDVGEFKAWSLQAAANRHTPRTINRIGTPFC